MVWLSLWFDYVDIINVWSLKCFLWYEFPVLETITILLFEQNKPIIKISIAVISKPYNCRSSVEVNSITDDIILNFKWLNAKCLPHQEETTINMHNLALSEASDGPYCDSNVNKRSETYAANLMF